ncbi:MAG: hypothetical protein L3J89_01225 [Gammaproteobacteria bacterium]|nr:hypothetical protein [Gammaproteobacteria bacterium]
MKSLFIVGPESFDLMPKIGSVIVRLTPRSEPAVKVNDEVLSLETFARITNYISENQPPEE